MRTIWRDWQELRSFAVVMLLIAGVSATTVISCGGGGGDSNGELCQQCGDSDGPCQDTVDVSGDDRPEFCRDRGEDPCKVELRCLRKLDSAQRRCFPADPVTNSLDILYRCDGARPNPSVVPTTTPTPVPTFTASASPTPTSTGSTPTGVTATPTGSSPTPTPTATPGDEVTVSITIDTDADEFTASFTVTVMYPPSKGDFLLNSAPDCDAGTEVFTPEDNGSGTLTLTFPADSARTFSIGVGCTFHQDAGPPLVNSDLSALVTPTSLTVEIDPL